MHYALIIINIIIMLQGHLTHPSLTAPSIATVTLTTTTLGGGGLRSDKRIALASSWPSFQRV
jgi:hypothetical protein